MLRWRGAGSGALKSLLLSGGFVYPGGYKVVHDPTFSAVAQLVDWSEALAQLLPKGIVGIQMLVAVGLDRRVVYICNVLKCRPPNNRDPEPAEVATCKPYLLTQLSLIRPPIIVCLGRRPRCAVGGGLGDEGSPRPGAAMA
jgi:hypothetical protein